MGGSIWVFFISHCVCASCVRRQNLAGEGPLECGPGGDEQQGSGIWIHLVEVVLSDTQIQA